MSEAESRPRANRLGWRLFVGIPLFLLGAGIVSDAIVGLPLSLGARSVREWLGTMTMAGAVYVVVGGALEWIGQTVDARDKPTHPLWRRVFHLGVLLAASGVLVVGAYVLLHLLQ
jgi:hypothetical protein